jgi:hypothetical protein
MPMLPTPPPSTALLVLVIAAGWALPGADTLRSGETLRPGRQLESSNRFHYLTFDLYGRPLLYARGRGTFAYFEVPLWVAPIPPGRSRRVQLTLEESNDLVLKGPRGEVLWHTGTAHQGEEPARLTVTDDGELCLHSGAACLWKSKPNINWRRKREPASKARGPGAAGWRSMLGLLAAVGVNLAG